MENNNDKSKTEKFTPMNKNPKPEINRGDGDAYSEARRAPEYDFNDNDDSGNSNLVAVSIILAVLLVIVIVLSIFVIGATKKDNKEEEKPPVKTEEIVEKEEKNEEKEVKTGEYNIVFYGETIIEKNGYSLIKADLFDDEMNMVESRTIKISPETIIISNGKNTTQKTLIHLIEKVLDEKIVFEGTIQEEDGLALRISFEYEEEELLENEEEIPGEPSEDVPSDENPEDVPEEIPEQDSEKEPVENKGTSIE